jgi:hypothetical protein
VGAGISGLAPYLYPENEHQPSLLDEVVRTPNLNMEIVNQIGEQLYFNPEEFDGTTTVETNVYTTKYFRLYLCGITQSNIQREIQRVFLKIDFPRVPYPKKSIIDLIDLAVNYEKSIYQKRNSRKLHHRISRRWRQHCR